jgi:hypothetical protein
MSTTIKDLKVDPPVEIKAMGSRDDRRYIDDQIRAVEQHLVDSLLTGLNCTWLTVDPSQTGTLMSPMCVATYADGTVVKATGANAKHFVGVALTAAQGGSKILVALRGVLPVTLTGIVNGGVEGFAVVDTSTGLPSYVASITSSSQVVIGRVSVAGTLTLLGGNVNYFSSGGAAPTGTGWYHVTSGVMDSAARAVDLSTADTTGTLAGSRVSPSFVGIVISDTAFSVGTAPYASTGALRFAKNQMLNARNNGNTADLGVIGTNSGDYVLIGDTANNNGVIIQTWSGGTLFMRHGTVDVLQTTSAGILTATPIIGDSGQSSPWSVHGTASVTLSGTTYSETAVNYRYTDFIYGGTPGGTATITWPGPTSNAFSYKKTVFNNTANSLIFTNGGGTTVTIAAGKTAMLVSEFAGVRRITADN